MSAGHDITLFFGLSLVMAAGMGVLLASHGFVVQVVLLAGLIAGLVFWFLPPDPNRVGVGDANRITLLRALPVVLMAGLVGQVELSDGIRWLILAAAVMVLALDGLDGWVARRTRSSSAFGARFDMELDALFILILCLLVWQAGQVGFWVLAIGLLRYVFVAAGWLLPALQQPLPESLRRKAVCVLQGGVLPLCLLPPVTPIIANLLAAGALGFLLYSFAVDTAWLLRTRIT